MYKPAVQIKNQRGYTLIELAIVGSVLVLLGVMGSSSFTKALDKASANTRLTVGRTLTTTFNVVSNETGTSRNTTQNDLPVSGNSIMDVLVLGYEVPAVINAAHQFGFNATGITSGRSSWEILTEPTAGNPGSYSLDGNAVTFDCDGTFCFTRYTDVKIDVAKLIWEDRFPSGTPAFDETQAQTGTTVTHGIATGTGQMTFDIRYTM